MNEIDKIDTLIERIANHPQSFILKADFSNAVSYITGFCVGRDGEFLLELSKFRDWLADLCGEKYGLPQNYTWSWYIENMYPNPSIGCILDAFSEYRDYVVNSTYKDTND